MSFIKVTATVLLVALIYTISFSNSLATSPVSTDWYSCKSEEDCAIMKGVCNWLAYNKKYESEVRINEYRDAHLRDCEKSPDFSGDIPKIECESNICILSK